MDNQLNVLSRKAGFNSALRHFKVTTELVSQINKGANFADLVNRYLDDGRISRHQIKPLVNALLVDKFGYYSISHNLRRTIEDVSSISDTVGGWTRLSIVCVFHHPHTGVFVINPKDPEAWDAALPLAKDELIVIHVGPASGEDVPASVLRDAASDLASLLDGRKLKGKKAYVSERKPAPASKPATAARAAQTTTQGPAAKETPAAEQSAAATEAKQQESAAAAAKKRRMTARIPVLVTNELFHNGNVEAWKKIIESYRAAYAGLDVLIWYENERINDINALFKWGKVKHGTPIMISVVGDEPKDVSKLRKYLYEGASPRFEAFLHGGADRILELF